MTKKSTKAVDGDGAFEIRCDARNYRIHDDRNKEMIRKSLERCGAGRSIVVDNTGMSIGGSGVLEQAQKLKIPMRKVETDGDELVVVVRRDLAPDDPRRKELALADNATSDASFFDFEAIGKDFDDGLIADYGIEMANDGNQDGGGEDIYTKKIKVPHYEPQMVVAPEISKLYDNEKAERLIREIENAELDDDVKNFLKIAAMRHVVFDYGMIAEFFAHAGKTVQELMIKSALVIIDFEDAIANGYVNLKTEIEKEFLDGQE